MFASKIALHGFVQDDMPRWIIFIMSTTFKYYFSAEKNSECEDFKQDEDKIDSANTSVYCINKTV